ncbi:MAG: hypothetical protein JSR69_23235 [Proteobacteria bacterium]|nr:hypothetical protein [Pseudomonadota bacterium]
MTLASGLLTPGMADAYCTTRERIQLRNEGVSPLEIDRLCGVPQQQQVEPQMPRRALPPMQQRLPMATVCTTNAGPCPMMVGMPVGSACACYTPWGAVPGIAR